MAHPFDAFFSPKSVAVIGASRTPASIGYVILENFLTGFKGKVYPVNPKARKIQGVRCYSSVRKVPGRIDLAVVTVPAKIAPLVYEECGEKGVKAVVMITAGFNEVGKIARTNQLKAVMKKHPKMRMMGPNCLGVLNTYNNVDTLFLPKYRLERPGPGNISFIAQSGAVGSAVLDWAGLQEYAMAKFASYGNALDVNETDLLEYLVQDKETDVICMYVEGFRDGRRFFEAAKRLSHKKPILLLKGGVTEAGSKATLSHTASMAGSNQVFMALFKQTALVHAKHMMELFDFARVFSRLAPPKGRRVQIITDGGGYGILTADALSWEGLELAEMSKKSVAEIRKVMPSYAVLKNPLDLTGDVDNKRYEVAVRAALNDKNVDAVAVILLYQVPTLDSKIVQVIAQLNRSAKKPMVVISVGGAYSELHKRALEKEGVVNFSYPFEAMRSLRKLYDWEEKKKKHARKRRR